MARSNTALDVGKEAGHHTATQDEINLLLVEHARAGRNVVRLKGGDPYVLGRGGEERLACERAGVPVEVVPGDVGTYGGVVTDSAARVIREDGAVIHGSGFTANAAAAPADARLGRLRGGHADSRGDHRIAMSLAIAAQCAAGEVRIDDVANVATSFPGFDALARGVGFGLRLA